MRNFVKKEVAGIYDGHRTDDKGTVVIARDSVSALFEDYPMLDRSVNGSKFKQSHSVYLGRNRVSGLVIDGYPLCDPILDTNVDSLGRFALCNSASSDITANVKLKWVPAPDLPADVVNNIADCECFVVCTRPIKKGEELLWNYPFSHHLSPIVKQKRQRVQKVVEKVDDGLDPDCVCPGDTRCKMNFCWFLGGRVLQTRRRKD
jgi:hypothetical protein